MHRAYRRWEEAVDVDERLPHIKVLYSGENVTFGYVKQDL